MIDQPVVSVSGRLAALEEAIAARRRVVRHEEEALRSLERDHAELTTLLRAIQHLCAKPLPRPATASPVAPPSPPGGAGDLAECSGLDGLIRVLRDAAPEALYYREIAARMIAQGYRSAKMGASLKAAERTVWDHLRRTKRSPRRPGSPIVGLGQGRFRYEPVVAAAGQFLAGSTLRLENELTDRREDQPASAGGGGAG